ncbi:MAG: hypothetical protein FWH18_08850 [Marinilabiliaceae bacterium]|nr:hypothetical protein [Marinilabiliaceae bacterium]
MHPLFDCLKSPELRLLVDRKGTPLHGVIYVALVPSAAAWGEWRALFNKEMKIYFNLKGTQKITEN